MPQAVAQGQKICYGADHWAVKMLVAIAKNRVAVKTRGLPNWPAARVAEQNFARDDHSLYPPRAARRSRITPTHIARLLVHSHLALREDDRLDIHTEGPSGTIARRSPGESRHARLPYQPYGPVLWPGYRHPDARQPRALHPRRRRQREHVRLSRDLPRCPGTDARGLPRRRPRARGAGDRSCESARR